MIFECEKCGGVWAIPDDVSLKALSEFAELVRKFRTIDAIRQFREATGLSLSEVKAILYHITPQPGKCHACKQNLNDDDSICPACGAMNHDWR